MSTFNELHHCTSNLHSEKRPAIFQNTEHIHRVLPVPKNHLLRFQGIECKCYIIVIYVIKCIQIPLTLSINFKLPYKTWQQVQYLPLLAHWSLRVSLVSQVLFEYARYLRFACLYVLKLPLILYVYLIRCLSVKDAVSIILGCLAGQVCCVI